MELIDTHCHLYLKEFDADRADVIQRAGSEGVSRFYLPSIDRSVFRELTRMEREFPGKCMAMAGLHPTSVKQDFKEELAFFEDAFRKKKYAAVGEIGLDFYWDRSFEQQQYAAFNEQIDWALQYEIPIVIHSRASMKQSIQVVRDRQKGKLKGIFHCFNDSLESALEIVDLGFYLGIGGVLTYKNSSLPEVVKQIDLRWLVLETDAPYLTPVPFRGKRNESAYLKYIAAKLAEIKGVDQEEVARVTSENARNIFGG
ncbi:MAG TPA: TatD family hydrolase [Puia sp.]|nr:TatD family hydrolase [Puia sp.]